MSSKPLYPLTARIILAEQQKRSKPNGEVENEPGRHCVCVSVAALGFFSQSLSFFSPYIFFSVSLRGAACRITCRVACRLAPYSTYK